MKSLIIKICTLYVIGLLCCQAQAQVQADPFVAGAITVASQGEQQKLDNIKVEQNAIQRAQTFINVELDKIREIQKKTYNYLSNVSAFVENAHDIKKSYELTVQIGKLCGELRKAIAENPQGLVTTAVGTQQIKKITVEMTSLYSYVTGLTLNKKVLLNSAERLMITGQVVYRLQNIHWQLYNFIFSIYSLSFKDLPRLLAPDIYYSTVAKKTIAENIISSW